MPPFALTPAFVRHVKAEARTREYRDTVEKGLVLCVERTGSKMYRYCYSRGGRQYRVPLGPPAEDFSLGAARARVRELRHEVFAGAHPAQERRQTRARQVLEVGAMVAQALEGLKLKPSTRREWERLARVELAPLARRPAAEVRRGEVRIWQDAIGARSASTARHALEVLRRCYSWSVKKELLEVNPAAGLEQEWRVPASRRVLTTLEVRALWEALQIEGETAFADAVRLLLLTGVRRAMVLGAERREFEGLDGRVGWRFFEGATEAEPRWTIPGGFFGRVKDTEAPDHVVPLSPQALVVVRRRMALASGEYLFPTFYTRRKGQEPSPHILALPSEWIAGLKRATAWTLWRLQAREDELGPSLAPMARWKLHGLRHTLATHMREDLRVERNVVALILGHAQSGGGGATKVYDRAELLAERAAALTAWGQWVADLGAEGSARVLPMRGEVKRG